MRVPRVRWILLAAIAGLAAFGVVVWPQIRLQLLGRFVGRDLAKITGTEKRLFQWLSRSWEVKDDGWFVAGDPYYVAYFDRPGGGVDIAYLQVRDLHKSPGSSLVRLTLLDAGGKHLGEQKWGGYKIAIPAIHIREMTPLSPLHIEVERVDDGGPIRPRKLIVRDDQIQVLQD